MGGSAKNTINTFKRWSIALLSCLDPVYAYPWCHRMVSRGIHAFASTP